MKNFANIGESDLLRLGSRIILSTTSPSRYFLGMTEVLMVVSMKDGFGI